MKPHYPLASALLLGSGLPTLAHADFIADSKASVEMRNFYFNRDFRQSGARDKAEEWAQGFLLRMESGYTEGTVGFGIDALGMLGLKLDSGDGTAGTGLLPADRSGGSQDDYSKLALTAKARISNSTLKVGALQFRSPIVSANGSRLLPQTFQGAQLTSSEIDGLTLYGGQFWKNSQRHDASREDMSFGGVKGDDFNFGGGEFRFNDNRTMVGAWHARLEDVYQQSFLQLTHSQPVGDWVLGANLGYFNGKDEGASKAGDLDNKVYQGALSAKKGNNTFQVTYQRLSGDTKFLRIDGASGGSLVNDGYLSAFDNPQERSWQLRHDYNFAGLGIPGLTLMNRYTSGSNIHTGGRTDAEEWSRETELAYTIQEGTLKNLNVRWRNSNVRRDVGQDLHENRLIINYPLSIL